MYVHDHGFEFKMQNFCNSMVYEGHSEELKFVEVRSPPRYFYIMKRGELQSGFVAWQEKIEKFVNIVINQTIILVHVLIT